MPNGHTITMLSTYFHIIRCKVLIYIVTALLVAIIERMNCQNVRCCIRDYSNKLETSEAI